MAKMNFTPADDMKDELWGPVGTPERDAMEAQLKEDIQALRRRGYQKGTPKTESHTRRVG